MPQGGDFGFGAGAASSNMQALLRSGRALAQHVTLDQPDQQATVFPLYPNSRRIVRLIDTSGYDPELPDG